MSFVWCMEKSGITGSDLCFVMPFMAAIVGLLMVSRFRYYSFKSLPMGDHVPFAWIVTAVLLLVLLFLDPPRVLLAVFSLYLLSGPVLTLWGVAARRRLHRGGGA
jgi:CDP-diacylglycerol--serine O-phosphatidyltransferase